MRGIRQETRDTRTELHQDNIRLDGKIDGINQNLGTRIDGVNHDLSAKIDAVNHDLSKRIDGVDGKIDGLNHGLSSLTVQMEKSFAAMTRWGLLLYFGLAATLLSVMARGFNWL